MVRAVHLLSALLCVLFLAVLSGCCGNQTDDRKTAIENESGGWKIVSVHSQNSGLLVSIEGMKTKKRLSVSVSTGDPIPEPGEVWKVEYKADRYNRLILVERLKPP